VNFAEVESMEHGATLPAGRHTGMSFTTDLSSTSTSLELLVTRVSTAADALVGTRDEDLSIALMEVERSLRTAGRRLDRVVRELRTRDIT
jgi:hypothetical protein